MKSIKFFLILVLYFTGLNTFGQLSLKDSIENIISNTPEKERAALTLDLSIDVSFIDLPLAEKLNSQAMLYYNKKKDSEGLAKAYCALAEVYFNNNIYDKALTNFEKALELDVNNKNLNNQAFNLNSIGFIYYYQNDLTKAISYFNSALKVAEGKLAKEEGNALNSLGNAYRRKASMDSAKMYFEKALLVLEKTDEEKTLARTYQNLGLINFESSNYNEAVKFYQLAETLYDKINDLRGQAITLNNIGNVYISWGRYENAISNYKKALVIFEELNIANGVASCLTNIGNIFISMKNLPAAKEYLEKALQQRLVLGNKTEIANAYLSLVSLYSAINDELFLKQFGSNWEKEIVKHFNSKTILERYKTSLDCNQKALDISIEINDIQKTASAYNNLGTIYSIAGLLDEALNFYNKALKLNRSVGNLKDECINLLAIGIVKNLAGSNETAIQNLKDALAIAQKLQITDIEKQIYQNLSVAYESTKNFEQSLLYHKKYSDLKDTLLNKESHKQVAEIQTMYETDKKEKEIALLNKDKALQENQIKQQKLAIFSFIAITIAIIGLILSLVRQNRARKRNNLELSHKNELISEQKKEITDSIHYASRIQRAILPPDEVISEHIPQHFILFRPRDIVSGDFYFFSEREGKVILVAADCTGHGVPGAFMSMLGTTMLHEIVSKLQHPKADSILNELRAQVIRALHQTGKEGESRDGMDLALYVLDRSAGTLEYAGANNPLVIVRNNELIELKADKMPIGIHDRINTPFTCNSYTIEPNDMIYTFSDGYVDQFGGPDGKKFMSKRFKQMLTEISQLDVNKQKEHLNKVLNEWIGDISQIDDILVIGVRC